MFKIERMDKPSYPAILKIPTTASETYTLGELLKMASGKLTKASGTDVPLYVSEQAYVAPASGNEDLSVHRINSEHEYRTTFAADGSSRVVGDKVTIHTDGAQITATTSSGVAEITKKLGTGASGTEALVRF